MASDTPTDTSEPIDAEFEPAPPRSEPERRKGPGWFATLMIAILAMIGGGALGYAGSEYLPGRLAISGDAPRPASASDLDAGLAAAETGRSTLRDSIAALERRLASTETELSQLASRDDSTARQIDRLSDRIGALETATPGAVAASDSLAAIRSRLDSVETDIRDVETQSGELAALRNELSALSTDIERLGGEVSALEVRLETQGEIARSRAASLSEAALALSTIEAAARRGQGFSAALGNLRAARPDAPGLAALEPIAAEGAPTLDQLSARFNDMVRDVEAAGRGETGDGALGIAEQIFGDAIEIRREGEVGTSPPLERARAALAEGDLGGAIAALETLPEPALEAARPWLDGARARRTLERSLDTLRLGLMREER